MPCFKPLEGYRSKFVNKTGKRSIVFNLREAEDDRVVTLPCGQCIGCRLNRSRQWAIRCMHEASLYKRNCFITLTFSPENLPKDGSLNKRDFVLFMKRLRKKFGEGIRFFHCGEYGEMLSRPHHHACLFNFDFDDKYLFSCKRGVLLYRSPILETLWPYGFSTVGSVTFESAAYVARYVTKKFTGKSSDEFYQGKVPEYVTMSRRPGIARDWFEQFKDDIYPSDYVVIRNGIKCRPPRYYDSIYDLQNPEDFDMVKERRKSQLDQRLVDLTPERLAVREKVQLARFSKLQRSYENGS